MTAAAFLAALAAETGSAPNAATYAQWESGKRTPKDASLAPVFAFWAARGVTTQPGAPVDQPASLEERAVLAAERSAAAAEALIEVTRQQNAMLRTLLVRAMSPDDLWQQELLPAIQEWDVLEEATPTPYTHQSPDPQVARAG